jgi:hypothetical protein
MTPTDAKRIRARDIGPSYIIGPDDNSRWFKGKRAGSVSVPGRHAPDMPR